MSSLSVSIVIPNFNGAHLLEKNLPRVVEAAKQYTKGKVDIIITDDHSTDNSLVFLEKFSKSEKAISITVVSNNNAQGFSCNVNSGVVYAKGDILLLLNTDAVPEANFILPLIEGFSDQNVFGVGCLEQTTDDSGHSKKYGRSFGSFTRGFIMHRTANPDESDKTFWVSCGSGAFRKNIWDKLSGLDELFNPFYWEDVDLSYRAVKSGFIVRFEKRSVIHHYHNEGAIKENFSPRTVTTKAYRNQIIFMWKNITDKQFLLENILYLPYYILKTLSVGDTNFISGLFEAVFLLTKIKQSRFSAIKGFIFSDKEVLEKQRV